MNMINHWALGSGPCVINHHYFRELMAINCPLNGKGIWGEKPGITRERIMLCVDLPVIKDLKGHVCKSEVIIRFHLVGVECIRILKEFREREFKVTGSLEKTLFIFKGSK